MANRILLGKSGSDYVLHVSQPSDNVLSPSEPLLFDSNVARGGEVYAGGNADNVSSSTGIDWSTTKGTLGYIPLTTSSDDDAGFWSDDDGSNAEWTDRSAAVYVTTTSIIPDSLQPGERNGSSAATNFKFIVLRIPCQYGKMNTTSLWD